MKRSELRQLIREEMLNEANAMRDVRSYLSAINKVMDKELAKLVKKLPDDIPDPLATGALPATRRRNLEIEFSSAQRVFNDTVIDLARKYL